MATLSSPTQGPPFQRKGLVDVAVAAGADTATVTVVDPQVTDASVIVGFAREAEGEDADEMEFDPLDLAFIVTPGVGFDVVVSARGESVAPSACRVAILAW
jgi:hypothetical protein